MNVKRSLFILLALFMGFNAMVLFLGAGGKLPESWIQKGVQDSGFLTLLAWLCVFLGLGLIVSAVVADSEKG